MATTSLFKVRLTEGLGDCLVAAAALQYHRPSTKIGYITSSLLEPVFRHHPTIVPFYDMPEGNYFQLKWVSQMMREGVNLYGLHTTQRFSYQLNYMIDPTLTMDIYDEKDKIVCDKSSKVVAINTTSAEFTRRRITAEQVEIILEEVLDAGFDPVFIGNCGEYDGIQDIQTCIDILRTCKLFIGPVSFSYHLASALKCKSLLFCQYMPYYKFSDFINTTSIYSSKSCVQFCEEKEQEMRTQENCFDFCKAIDYPESTIREKLRRCLQ